MRSLALNRWNQNHTQKRNDGMATLLSELEDCIPAPETVEQEIEERELSGRLSVWLDSLEREERMLFVRRYWYGIPLRDLAKEQGMFPDRLAQRMLRLRRGLKQFLEKEGVF